MNNEESVFVLYVDHQGHPAPLSSSYHATASRRLASAIDRHPPSTMTEVDSAYCPQCLSFHDASTAANLGYCPKPSCRLCPLCPSVAAVAVDEGEVIYKCGICSWTSRDCSLSASVPVSNEGVAARADVEQAVEELGTQWKTRMEQSKQGTEEHYKSMSRTLERMAKEQVKGKASSLFIPSSAAALRRGMDGPEGWSVESLEEALVTREKLVAASIAETVGGQNLQTIPLEIAKTLDVNLEQQSTSALLLHDGGTAVTTKQNLLPLPIPLRPRKSRRCRAELADGRPGILVKPKLNPLEGDSSLRTGHGQWWKKDSSAIQVLPRVRVSKHASDETRHAFLFRVANPTLGKIRLQLAASKFSGEPVWDDKTKKTPLMENLLVDDMTQQFVDAELELDVAQKLQKTEMAELEATEDSFLELGKSSTEEPDEVSKWNASDVLAASKVAAKVAALPSSLRLVGQKNSCAWFELVVLERKMEAGLNNAIPLALQIEVGNGSWDSSLIHAEPVKGEGTKDMVIFDLVVIWNSSK